MFPEVAGQCITCDQEEQSSSRIQQAAGCRDMWDLLKQQQMVFTLPFDAAAPEGGGNAGLYWSKLRVTQLGAEEETGEGAAEAALGSRESERAAAEPQAGFAAAAGVAEEKQDGGSSSSLTYGSAGAMQLGGSVVRGLRRRKQDLEQGAGGTDRNEADEVQAAAEGAAAAGGAEGGQTVNTTMSGAAAVAAVTTGKKPLRLSCRDQSLLRSEEATAAHFQATGEEKKSTSSSRGLTPSCSSSRSSSKQVTARGLASSRPSSGRQQLQQQQDGDDWRGEQSRCSTSSSSSSSRVPEADDVDQLSWDLGRVNAHLDGQPRPLSAARPGSSSSNSNGIGGPLLPTISSRSSTAGSYGELGYPGLPLLRISSVGRRDSMQQQQQSQTWPSESVAPRAGAAGDANGVSQRTSGSSSERGSIRQSSSREGRPGATAACPALRVSSVGSSSTVGVEYVVVQDGLWSSSRGSTPGGLSSSCSSRTPSRQGPAASGIGSTGEAAGSCLCDADTPGWPPWQQQEDAGDGSAAARGPNADNKRVPMLSSSNHSHSSRVQLPQIAKCPSRGRQKGTLK